MREENAEKFLSDLRSKKQQVILHKILTTREGPQILHTQKQKLIETMQHPSRIGQSGIKHSTQFKQLKNHKEDAMSVDETTSLKSMDLQKHYQQHSNFD